MPFYFSSPKRRPLVYAFHFRRIDEMVEDAVIMARQNKITFLFNLLK